MYLAELENPACRTAIWRETPRGEAVGFCSFWRVLDELHINNLAVLPEHRRAGIGVGAARRSCWKKGVELGRDARHARGAALERAARSCCTSGLASRSPASGAATTRNPVEDALVLWRENATADR